MLLLTVAAAAVFFMAAALQKGTVQVLFYMIPADGVPGASDGLSLPVPFKP